MAAAEHGPTSSSPVFFRTKLRSMATLPMLTACALSMSAVRVKKTVTVVAL
jgi:hypothetical protein